MREQIKQRGGNRGTRRHQERNQNRKSPEIDYDLAYDMSVGDMTRFLKKEYDIDFYQIEQKTLKNRAINNESYLLDIACDIKELLTSEDNDRYFNMDVLLSEFKRVKDKE